MIKDAASLWGIPQNEIDTSFDPVISLLLSACASEIAKVSDRITESQNRITEKIVQLMIPETIFGPKPSNSIICVSPTENEKNITPDFSFSFKKKDTRRAKDVFTEVFFSPIQNFKIVNAQIEYLVSSNSFTKVSSRKDAETLLHLNEKNIDESSLYIGVKTEIEPKDLNLKNVSVYFELQDYGLTNVFFHHLQNAKFYCNKKELKTRVGLSNIQEEEDFLKKCSLKTQRIIDEIKNNYQRHYITIEDNFDTAESHFTEVDEIIQKNRLKIEGNIVWLKVKFPKIINSSFFDSLFCSLNSFPVINTKISNFSFQLKEFINIVPIRTDSLFLDVNRISNLNNQVYEPSNGNFSNTQKGVFSIKTDSISRLDKSKAKDKVNHLLEVLRDESAAFSNLNNDFLHTNLKELNQIISQLENKTSSSPDEAYTTNYIEVNPFKSGEILQVEYLTTNGEFANNIKSGSVVKNYKTSGLQQKSSFLLVSSHGGRDSLNMKERLQAYRRSLLSRDKIVTKEDIRLVCYEFFGDRIEKVEIKNSYTIDISLSNGMVNCIDIILTSSKECDDFEWDFIQNNLLLYLKKNSTNVFPFVIKKL